MVSTTTLRHRRELRYSRDEKALSASLSHCALEPSLEQLQILALERVKKELEVRTQGHQQRIHLLRDKFANQNAVDDQSHAFFLCQRLLEERRLAATRKEESVVIEQLVQLRRDLCSLTMRSADGSSKCYPEGATRTNTNLSLFLQKSATKRPLSTPSRSHSAGSLQKTNVSRVRNSVPSAFRDQHNRSHLRSQPLIEDSQANKLYVEEDQRTGPSSSSSCLRASLHSERHFPHADLVVPAVDEFSNSFSSRVIAPPLPRSKRASSLRSLHMSTRARRRLLFYEQLKAPASSSEYGNVTIISRTKPRSKSEFLEDMSSVPLPTYVHNLMNDFDQTLQPPLALGLSERRIPEIPTLRKSIPLSPVFERPSTPLSSIKGRSSPKSMPKSTGRKLSQKQRSIFTLRLPLRPSVPDSASRSTLAASSSTSVFESADGHSLAAQPAEPAVRLRTKGLPSTRNHDLSMLGIAPDDVPESPLFYPPLTPTPVRNRTSRPFSVLRDVKSKLVQLGRR